MTEVRGDALEWAIALAKAPAERVMLRQRPLPGGIETVLQIATGVSANALADAALRTNEPETELVEAARFYIREVLFFQGANAYRVLGLTRDTEPDTIRTHYRLLQQWLHPDRHTSDWDAIFASRVNIAWNQLRTPARRAEYDAQLPVKRDGERGGSRWAKPNLLTGLPVASMERDENHRYNSRWRRRAPSLGLFAICFVLGIAALLDRQRAPVGDIPEQLALGGAEKEGTTSTTLKVPEVFPLASSSALRKPSRAQRAVTASQSGQRSTRELAEMAQTLGNSLPQTSPVPVIETAEREAEKPMRAVSISSISISEPPKVAAVAGPPKVAATSAESVPALAPKPPNPSKRFDASLADARQSKSTARNTTSIQPALQTASQQPAPSPQTVKASVVTASAVASQQQLQKVQETGKKLIGFVTRSSQGSPAIWDNPNSQAQALQVRVALTSYSNVRGSEPHWSVGGDRAVMSSQLRAGALERQLLVSLIWREQRWLVSDVALEQPL